MKIADEDVSPTKLIISVAYYPRVPNRIPNVCCDTDLLFNGLIYKIILLLYSYIIMKT